MVQVKCPFCKKSFLVDSGKTADHVYTRVDYEREFYTREKHGD